MTRARYKSVVVRDEHIKSPGNAEQTVTTLKGLGQCDLEMRIYKQSPLTSNLKPLMVIHGGDWRFRGSAFTAFESEISHLTERGFVVFAPFYRLVDDVDGNAECNNAKWPDLISDVNDALDWVQNNGVDYGAISGEVYLLGGSAGGHLASWLTVNRPDEIARTLLFYPPTDFRYYVSQAQQSMSTLKGEGYMKGYLGVENFDDLPLDSPDLIANSFPDIVVKNPSAYPPIAMIHGLKDKLVPADQSVRLCNALNGDIEQGAAQEIGGDKSLGDYSRRYACGEHGELHIVNEGDHGLDVCVKHIECPAGSKNSQRAIKSSMTTLFNWLAK